MNQSQSTYKTDYTPHAWLENNFNTNVVEFCSSDNIDDCLKYVSQEFSALGYPSIYSEPNSCPYAVNCDIVKLLNIIFELLKDFKCYAQTKEELEDRNQRYLCDINNLNKRNSQLKERLEQSERKYNSALEKERQLKCKNDNLQSQIKTEKDETKKLLAQIQHQKTACQHEIRKYENNLNQMKSRLNQVLVDKNPDKKVANISTSHLLQRSSCQRGKWKTGSSAKSSTDDMYNSLISNFENRCQVAVKEVEKYNEILKYIDTKLVEIIKLEDECFECNLPNLYAAMNKKDSQSHVKNKYGAMLSKLKEIVVHKQSENQSLSLQLASFETEKVNLENTENNYQRVNNRDSRNLSSRKDSNCKLIQPKQNATPENIKVKNVKENLSMGKTDLLETLAEMKIEKAKLEAQKLEFIKFTVDQKSSLQPHSSNSVPSFSIVTTKDGVTAVPLAYQLKQCLSCPSQLTKSFSPLWKTDLTMTNESSTPTSPSVYYDCSTYSSMESTSNNFAASELPKWAQAAVNSPILEQKSIYEESFTAQNESCISPESSFFNEEFATPELQASEEENLVKLKAAVADIERRRNSAKSQ